MRLRGAQGGQRGWDGRTVMQHRHSTQGARREHTQGGWHEMAAYREGGRWWLRTLRIGCESSKQRGWAVKAADREDDARQSYRKDGLRPR